jgi:uncharacterized membrane protein YphA (DoxX/SURF4 family)
VTEYTAAFNEGCASLATHQDLWTHTHNAGRALASLAEYTAPVEKRRRALEAVREEERQMVVQQREERKAMEARLLRCTRDVGEAATMHATLQPLQQEIEETRQRCQALVGSWPDHLFSETDVLLGVLTLLPPMARAVCRLACTTFAAAVSGWQRASTTPEAREPSPEYPFEQGWTGCAVFVAALLRYRPEFSMDQCLRIWWDPEMREDRASWRAKDTLKRRKCFGDEKSWGRVRRSKVRFLGV